MYLLDEQMTLWQLEVAQSVWRERLPNPFHFLLVPRPFTVTRHNDIANSGWLEPHAIDDEVGAGKWNLHFSWPLHRSFHTLYHAFTHVIRTSCISLQYIIYLMSIAGSDWLTVLYCTGKLLIDCTGETNNYTFITYSGVNDTLILINLCLLHLNAIQRHAAQCSVKQYCALYLPPRNRENWV